MNLWRERKKYSNTTIERMMIAPPFSRADQLNQNPLERAYRHNEDENILGDHAGFSVPGYKHLAVPSSEARDFLHAELLTPRLNRLYRYLWLVAKQDSTHVSCLTEQAVRGRRIIVTEDPELHLVWYHDRIYMKPLPKYLLSYDFWQEAFYGQATPFDNDSERQDAMVAARGFLRSYTYLIQRPSDFALATSSDHCLLPDIVNFSAYVTFANSCQNNICDADVSPRYHYGELRLSRLNLWSKISLNGLAFKKIHHQYSDEIARFYGPLLFAFAIVSVVLNAMQVVLTAEQVLGPGHAAIIFSHFSLVFSILTLCTVAMATGALCMAIVIPLFRELIFAVGHLMGGKRRDGNHDSASEKG
ncbi:hypothetical protein LTR78_003398 [Recurvomyces mirabilis]|uniref:Uncharacterized protein n=1 Tax=Recurvomyces mirabilis TaxID=574656 RepID=A0AAE1C3C7_9PEZI|nr:hypothetical protein LTR78_003398 [Recurvomyces mirabilis]KAK5154567.1 hypothetical protein LTS14_006705 [Recurvomyces mirabilis]